MAKQTVKTKPAPKNEVAVRSKSGSAVALQSSLKNRIKADSGKGLSTDMRDNVVPLIYVLQAQSPQTQKKHAKYVEGAEAGSLWLRNSSDPIVPEGESIQFQPCFYWRGWIEWKPNREGFVARHNTKPAGVTVKKMKDEKGNPIEREVTAAGNILVESMEWAGYVLGRGAPMGYVLPCSGSNRAFAKELMTTLNGQFSEEGDKLPPWFNIVNITTKYRTNDKGAWYMLSFDSALEQITTEEDYIRGVRLHDAFATGAKQADVDDTHADAVGTEGSEDDDV